MKIRTDLTAFSLTGLCVVAMVVLAALHQPIPELLATITLLSVGIGGGAAIPRTLGSSSTPAEKPTAELASYPLPPQRAPLPAPGPVGRDWTEVSIPKITPDMVAADLEPRR